MSTLPPDPGAAPQWRRPIVVAAAVAALAGVVAATVFLIGRGGSNSASRTVSTAGTGASSGAGASTGSASTGTANATSGAATTPGTGSGGGAAASCTPGQGGALRQDTEFTAADGTVVRYSISFPQGYWDGCPSYPVMYALHGRDQNNTGFMDEALGLRKAMDAGVLDQAIIVTPDSFSTGRWEDRDTGPAETNVIERLIPHVEQTYRVRPGASNRLLVGFSMGGHGAIRFGLKYPNLWAAVWSVDGAMAGSDAYYPFVEGKTSADFQILTVGGQLNGNRVKTLVDDLKTRGIDIPYTYEDVEHTFAAFLQQDEKLGWPAMKFLQERLGRAL